MKHVLVVDDALDLGRLLKTTLSLIDASMPIVVVPSGEEALLESSRYPLDLLVTDIRLPGISGFELIKKVRVKHPNVRIILITGMTDDDVRRKVNEIKVDAFFYKPMDIPEFTEAARRCLDLHQPKTSDISEIPSANPASFADKHISDALVEIRKRLDARTILLLDERGRVGAQAGEPVDSNFEMVWSPDVLTSLSAAAKISRHLQQSTPQNVLAFWGKSLNMVLAPVGNFALVLLLEAGKSKLRLALAFEEVVYAQQDLEKVLGGVNFVEKENKSTAACEDVNAESPNDEPLQEAQDLPVEKEADFENLTDLIQQSTQKIEATEIEAFWEALPSAKSVEPEEAGIITYEQARKLGLVPDEEK